MRLDAITLVVTSLIAFTNAYNVAPMNIAYNKDALKSHSIVDRAGGDACGALGCHASLPYCLKQCGSGPHCKDYCACYLHSDPTSICRQLGCVEAPQDCDKWEPTERDTALAGPAIANSDSIAAGDQQSPPMDDCQICQAAVYTCQQNCHGDEACEAACNCPITDQDSCHKCSTTTCSTTAPSAETNNIESPPIDHCQVCRSAIYTCQQNCNGDQTCKTSCLCPSTERESCGKCDLFNCPSS